MTNTVVSKARQISPAGSAAAVTGLVGALATSSCCMLPLGLFTLGASGAWISPLVQLAPYQPYFMAATIACLGCGYWLVYRAPRIECAEGRACGSLAANRFVKSALVLATVLVAAAIGFNFLAPLLNS